MANARHVGPPAQAVSPYLTRFAHRGHTSRLMAHRRFFPGLFVMALVLALPSLAHAQYKNKNFGFDVSYQLITQPSITDSGGGVLDPGLRGDRLHDAIRVGGEGGFKLHHDHWWFNARLDLSFLGYGRPKGTSLAAQADQLAGAALGLNMGIDGQIVVRYYILTDHFRPYIQVSASYMRIVSFGASEASSCGDPVLCKSGGTYTDNFMPHVNIVAIHVAPSMEFIVRRDLGLHIILDYQRWLVVRGQGNNVFTMGAGLTFYG